MIKKDFRILLTENCNANCANCFNKTYRSTSDMNLTDLEYTCKKLSQWGISTLKIMGGEPTFHPKFFNAILIIQNYFPNTILFTNALNDNILNYEPRTNDNIVYNSDFINDNFPIEKFLLDKPGIRSFEIQVSSNTNLSNLKDKLLFIETNFKKKKKPNYYLTLNCEENIYNKRSEIISNWNELVAFIKKDLNNDYYVDHIIPNCFYKNTNMIFPFPKYLCNPYCAGLIDVNLNLRYCNQFPIVLSDFKSVSNHEALINTLQKGFEKKIKLAKNNKCRLCQNSECNGGCFIHKDIFKVKVSSIKKLNES